MIYCRSESTPRILLALCLLMLGTQWANAEGNDKKLIKHGWDRPSAEYTRDHIREMEKLPFSGVTVKWPDGGGGAIFRPVKADSAELESYFTALSEINWDKFTDNFIPIITADYTDERLDWFNPEHWEAVEHNTALLMKAVQAGRCVGILFDPEDYGKAPWSYPKAHHHDSKSFSEYQHQVRERGRQWMAMVQDKKPDVRILILFMPDAFANAAELEEILQDYNYGLFPSFVNGMLDAAGPGVELIDGNEASYYYTKKEEYLDAFHHIRQRKLQWIEPALHDKYRSQVRAGSALYIDYLFPHGPRKEIGGYLTHNLRLQWLEHNAYWSLATTDEYVWIYSEHMNWWTGQEVPEGATHRIVSARRQLREGTPPDATFTGFMDVAKEALRQSVVDGTQRRIAHIARRPTSVKAPQIDGMVDDEIWAGIEPLGPFVSPALYAPVDYQTEALVVYDDEAIYIAFKCEEPNISALRIWDDGHDDDNLWRGDVVEIFISDGEEGFPFRHFMVNPSAGYWDSLDTKVGGRPHADRSYDPVWQRAASVGERVWYAEAAIPWTSLGRAAPSPGEKLRVNLGRHRHQGTNYSSMWSPSRKSFQEPEHFGTWILGQDAGEPREDQP